MTIHDSYQTPYKKPFCTENIGLQPKEGYMTYTRKTIHSLITPKPIRAYLLKKKELTKFLPCNNEN